VAFRVGPDQIFDSLGCPSKLFVCLSMHPPWSIRKRFLEITRAAQCDTDRLSPAAGPHHRPLALTPVCQADTATAMSVGPAEIQLYGTAPALWTDEPSTQTTESARDRGDFDPLETRQWVAVAVESIQPESRRGND
jgi:hypothetical protein